MSVYYPSSHEKSMEVPSTLLVTLRYDMCDGLTIIS